MRPDGQSNFSGRLAAPDGGRPPIPVANEKGLSPCAAALHCAVLLPTGGLHSAQPARGVPPVMATSNAPELNPRLLMNSSNSRKLRLSVALSGLHGSNLSTSSLVSILSASGPAASGARVELLEQQITLGLPAEASAALDESASALSAAVCATFSNCSAAWWAPPPPTEAWAPSFLSADLSPPSFPPPPASSVLEETASDLGTAAPSSAFGVPSEALIASVACAVISLAILILAGRCRRRYGRCRLRGKRSAARGRARVIDHHPSWVNALSLTGEQAVLTSSTPHRCTDEPTRAPVLATFVSPAVSPDSIGLIESQDSGVPRGRQEDGTTPAPTALATLSSKERTRVRLERAKLANRNIHRRQPSAAAAEAATEPPAAVEADSSLAAPPLPPPPHSAPPLASPPSSPPASPPDQLNSPHDHPMARRSALLVAAACLSISFVALACSEARRLTTASAAAAAAAHAGTGYLGHLHSQPTRPGRATADTFGRRLAQPLQRLAQPLQLTLTYSLVNHAGVPHSETLSGPPGVAEVIHMSPPAHLRICPYATARYRKGSIACISAFAVCSCARD